MQKIFAGITNFNKRNAKLSLEPKAAYNPERERKREKRERVRERKRGMK